MKFYIQINKDGYITDCVQREHAGYIPVTLSIPLPDGFISGCYKYLGDNKYELDKSKASVTEAASIEQLRADIDYLAIMQGVDLNV